ncbi:flagellar hook capping FlgD N-terminal domain-containing protein [Thioclava sp. A2]|uniref:flagellar hook capping FlgD N-terminal domain-containing protein n=1 Tax=Thioclava sp. FCG-A2 TaxID=3080562 RepID=UPI002955D355|nr:flagellar hook capping FlgD N-terminal domain-containing protein [Thioclava sp. A2]MDV7270677.1 flagellar hook capping FlgD N-terminal domain-containing protein [Thioclava sp. A2]
MTTVNAVTSATATSTTGSSATTGSALSGDFETFLKMLTVQMQNQDPMNPIESSDYAVQLATFSGVEQQVQTNQLLEGLASQLGLMGMSELAGWVGMEARSASPAHFSGDPVRLAPNPPVAADRAVLVVRNEAGDVVSSRSIDVSAEQTSWDGTDAAGNTLPEGNYSFELESYENGELLQTDPVETYSRIVEAQGTASGTVLLLEGGITIGTGDVTALREPTA